MAAALFITKYNEESYRVTKYFNLQSHENRPDLNIFFTSYNRMNG